MYRSEAYKEGYKAGDADYWTGPNATTECPYIIQDHLNWRDWNEGYSQAQEDGSKAEDFVLGFQC